MVFPIIPLLAIAALIGGTGTLVWYYNLPPKKRKEADRKANEYAMSLFEKQLDELTRAQARQVHEKVKREMIS